MTGLIDAMVKVVNEVSIPNAPSTFTVNASDMEPREFKDLGDALFYAGGMEKKHKTVHIQVRATYDDAVKLVKFIKTRKVKLLMMVSHYAPDAKAPNCREGRPVHGYIPVTRGAVLVFLEDVYGKRRNMVMMDLYAHCLFVGASV